MSKDRLKDSKKRYARLIEAEAIILDVFEVIGGLTTIDVNEYREDLKVVINVLAHYKHREVATITGAELNITHEEVAPVTASPAPVKQEVKKAEVKQPVGKQSLPQKVVINSRKHRR